MIWNSSVKYTREIWDVSFAVAAKWCARFLLRPTKLSARANAWPNTDPALKKIKQKYSNDSTHVSWPSKAPSATEEKLFELFLKEKWFDYHFSSYFQSYTITKNIFSIKQQDQSAAIIKYNFGKFLIRHKILVYFSWFFQYTTKWFFYFAAISKCSHHKI